MSIKTLFKYGVLLLILLSFSGCMQTKINITTYTTSVNDKVSIPEICQPYYKMRLPTIAVMDFTNNSTFGKASVYYTSSAKKAGVLGGIIIDNGIGVGGTVRNNKSSVNVKREVDAKLSTTLTPLLETKISALSGITLVTRSDIEKINEELKLQDSGLLDTSTSVKVGQLLGAKYIVTGSIDNVEINRRDNEGAFMAVNNVTSRTDYWEVQAAGLFGRLLTSFTDGLLIKTTVTVKVLDVQTGQILHAQTIQDDVHIGKFTNPTYDVYIGGIKAAIIDSLEDFDYTFKNQFSLTGYITKVRANNDDMIAQINLGTEHKVHEGDIFKVYKFEENIDPLTQQKSCDKIELPIVLKATSAINSFTSWVQPTTQESPLQVLQYVERANEESIFDLPMF